MHERALMRDVLAKVEAVAQTEGAARVTRIHVRLGALSHFTPEHFREHFADAACGSVAEGAHVDAVVDGSTTAPYARDVVVVSVEVELTEPAEAR